MIAKHFPLRTLCHAGIKAPVLPTPDQLLKDGDILPILGVRHLCSQHRKINMKKMSILEYIMQPLSVLRLHPRHHLRLSSSDRICKHMYPSEFTNSLRTAFTDDIRGGLYTRLDTLRARCVSTLKASRRSTQATHCSWCTHSRPLRCVCMNVRACMYTCVLVRVCVRVCVCVCVCVCLFFQR
jgi:hypothetical protein